MGKVTFKDNAIYSDEEIISTQIFNSPPPDGQSYETHKLNDYESLLEELEGYVNKGLLNYVNELKLSKIPRNIRFNLRLNKSLEAPNKPIDYISMGKNKNGGIWYSIEFLLEGIVNGIKGDVLSQKFEEFCKKRKILSKTSRKSIDGLYYGEFQVIVKNYKSVDQLLSAIPDLAMKIIDTFVFSIIGLEGVLEVWEYWQENRSETSESKWQEKFSTYPWVLGQSFATPNLLFEEQCYVGGTLYSGKGSKYPDFVYETIGTGNMLIVEIKLPTQPLMVSTGKEHIFAPSSYLTKAVAQVLFYRHEALMSYNGIVGRLSLYGDKSKIRNLVNPRCLVVIGSLDDFKGDDGNAMRHCFDLYRNELRGVDVITYDELFEKIRIMMRLVASKYCPLILK